MAKELNKNFNLLLFFLLILAFIGSMWLAWRKVDAGFIYSLMWLAVPAATFLIFLFIKEDKELNRITEFIKSPFTTSLGVASIGYLVGWMAPLVLKLLAKIIGAFTGSVFSTTGFAIPLYGNSMLQGITQSFSAAEIGNSMQWKIFSISFTAGSTETFAYVFGAMLVGVLIGLLILQLINNGKGFGFISRRFFVISVAMIFSTGLFIASHQLNSTYAGTMFVIAGLFQLANLIGTYVSGLTLTFWIGYHQSNNLLWLFEKEGFFAVAQGFVSWFGLIFVALFLMLILYVSRNWSDILKNMSGKKSHNPEI